MLDRLANYSFNWKLTLFTLLLFPLMIKLGFWQLEREQEKLGLQMIYEQRQSSPSQNFNQIDWQGDLLYRPVELLGSFDNEHIFLLDNKINAGKVGFEIISPFFSQNNEVIFVNRGWLPQGQYRTDVPVIENVDGEVEIEASIYVPLGEQIMLGEDVNSGIWPRIIQSLEPTILAEQLNLNEQQKVFPYSLRLQENTVGVLTRNWPLISTNPEKHKGYAVQWFLMASVLLGLYIFVSTKPDEINREDNG